MEVKIWLNQFIKDLQLNEIINIYLFTLLILLSN